MTSSYIKSFENEKKYKFIDQKQRESEVID